MFHLTLEDNTGSEVAKRFLGHFDTGETLFWTYFEEQNKGSSKNSLREL